MRLAVFNIENLLDTYVTYFAYLFSSVYTLIN